MIALLSDTFRLAFKAACVFLGLAIIISAICGFTVIVLEPILELDFDLAPITSVAKVSYHTGIIILSILVKVFGAVSLAVGNTLSTFNLETNTTHIAL